MRPHTKFVSFIVLNLRLTMKGLGGVPFYLPFSQILLQEFAGFTETFYLCTHYYILRYKA